MGSLDVDEIYKEMLDEFNLSCVPKDFIKSVNFAVWQLRYLLRVADILIAEGDLGLDDKAEVVGALLRLMEVAV